jgi:heme/copper-type cytochrome/quinol oxidase subunit 2
MQMKVVVDSPREFKDWYKALPTLAADVTNAKAAAPDNQTPVSNLKGTENAAEANTSIVK